MDYETGSRLERIEAKLDYFIEKYIEAEKKAKKYNDEPEVPVPEYKKK